MDSQTFLDERQLASTIGCSVPAIRHWRRGGLPYYRFGRLVRFRLDDVLAWFKERPG